VRLLIVGAGGHAKVVVDAARACEHDVVAILGAQSDPAEVLGYPVSSDASAGRPDGFVVAVGDNATRSRLFSEHQSLGRTPLTVIHPAATIAPSAEIGGGTFIAAGVIVNPGARIGRNVILNTGCVIDHDVVVGDHAHVAPNAALCGAARVGEGTLVGVGASIVPGASVGEWSVIGAGAAVVDDLPARSVCAGVPARPLREVER